MAFSGPKGKGKPFGQAGLRSELFADLCRSLQELGGKGYGYKGAPKGYPFPAHPAHVPQQAPPAPSPASVRPAAPLLPPGLGHEAKAPSPCDASSERSLYRRIYYTI